MKVVIVDDERLAIDLLVLMCEKIDGIEVIGTYTNPSIALKEIPKLPVDVVFLDIEMGSKDGLEIAKILKENRPLLPIIFVTAFEQYAVKAFEVKATDYLLKPIRLERLQATIEHTKQKIERYQAVSDESKQEAKNFFFTAKAMGSFKLYDQKQEEVKWRTRKVKELFVYLWHHYPQSVLRDRILEDLWPDQLEDRATTLMHTTLYQLRKSIRAYGFEHPVVLLNEHYGLNLEIENNVKHIKTLLQIPSLTPEQAESLIDLYEGDYLAEENYEWAIQEREHLQLAYLASLERFIAKKIERGIDSRLVERCLEKMIDLDPYNVKYMHLYIEYYGNQQKYQKMYEVFTLFKDRWVQDLGMDMPKELYALYNTYLKKH